MDSIRSEVWQSNMSLYENRLVYGTQGNVSGIDISRKIIYIKPSGVSYEKLTQEKIVEVDCRGKVKKGSLKPSVDTPHHLFLYRHLKETGGICHTHSRFITVFAILEMDVPVLTTAHADVFGTGIPIAEYADNRQDNIGRVVLECYNREKCSAVILGKHGLFTMGQNAEKAAFYAIMAEYCAEVAYYTMMMGKTLGKKVQPLSKKEIKKWYDRYNSSLYGQK